MINDTISELLENNRHYFGGLPIAFDGVVDEESYCNSKIKTLFLMKEINDPGMKEDWKTFMEYTKQQASVETMYKTWPNICLWIEALKHSDVTYSDCVDENGNFLTKKLQKNLLDVSIVNIKKTAGGGSSNYDEILSAAKSYGHVIQEEIRIINPELIICGGTFDFAKMIYKVESAEIKSLPSGAQYFIVDNIIILQFVHPMWFSVNRNILFAYAKSVFSDVHSLPKM